jgi:hypothetical protein
MSAAAPPSKLGGQQHGLWVVQLVQFSMPKR